MFSEKEGEITAEDVATVDAGVPFLYVGNQDDRLTIPQDNQDYKDVSTTNVLSGFYISLPNREDPLHGTAYALRKKSDTDNTLGYYTGSGFNCNDPANCGYISAETAKTLNATAIELEFGTDNSTLTVKIISAETGLINECVELAKKLKDLKGENNNNIGTDVGQYNVTNTTLTDDESSYWNALDNYDDAADNFYTTNASNKTKLEELKNALESILHKVLETNVHGLKDVEIFTLQWNNGGQYAGLNSGSKWEDPSGFNNPNGGNGRIGLVKKEGTTNRYYIACQGLFIKIEGEKRKTATGRSDATAFIVIRSSENGLTFVTDDWNYYLTATNFTPSTTAPTTDYKINTYSTGNAKATNIQVVEDKVKTGDDSNGYIYYNSLVYPFKVEKPSGDNYKAFVLSKDDNGNITAEAKDEIDAGTPFIYITTSKDDDARMTIPQVNQEYSENVKDNVLKGFYMPLNADSQEHTEAYSLSIKDGKVGYFLGGHFGGENTPANRGYIDATTAMSLNAESFELVYANGTLTVNVIHPMVTVTTTENGQGWATLYSDKALDFSEVEGLTAYVAKLSDDNSSVTLTSIDKVPANTGLVLKGEANQSYAIPVTTEEIADDLIEQNDLDGSTTEVAYNSVDGCNLYVLALNKDNVQFMKLASGGTSAAGKAYLKVPATTSETRVISVVFEGETTGINETSVNGEQKTTGAYNLNGQRVAQPTKGLYIVNGKKVVVK